MRYMAAEIDKATPEEIIESIMRNTFLKAKEVRDCEKCEIDKKEAKNDGNSRKG